MFTEASAAKVGVRNLSLAWRASVNNLFVNYT